jgi:hypothetical protein
MQYDSTTIKTPKLLKTQLSSLFRMAGLTLKGLRANLMSVQSDYSQVIIASACESSTLFSIRQDPSNWERLLRVPSLIPVRVQRQRMPR